jgi:hypothetical protein
VFREALIGRDVIVARTVVDASSLLQTNRWAAVIVTNYGVGATDAVAIVPAQRPYPALLVTNHWDAQLEEECLARDVRVVHAPVELTVLRKAVDDAISDHLERRSTDGHSG